MWKSEMVREMAMKIIGVAGEQGKLGTGVVMKCGQPVCALGWLSWEILGELPEGPDNEDAFGHSVWVGKRLGLSDDEVSEIFVANDQTSASNVYEGGIERAKRVQDVIRNQKVL